MLCLGKLDMQRELSRAISFPKQQHHPLEYEASMYVDIKSARESTHWHSLVWEGLALGEGRCPSTARA